jgi:hypothetical protein
MAVNTELLQHRGRTYLRLPAQAIDRFVVGVDLGQSVDSTAVSVIHHTRTPLQSWSITEAKSANHYSVMKQDICEFFDVRHLERLPLGVPYPEQVQRVADIVARPPLRSGVEIVVDQTGVGAAVADLFDRAGLHPVRVVIGAGFEAVRHAERKWVVPKSELISGLDARLHAGELRIAKELSEATVLADELRDFRRLVSEAGRASYSARAGKHDDLVLSVAIALWWLTKPRRGEHSHGGVRGLF